MRWLDFQLGFNSENEYEDEQKRHPWLESKPKNGEDR
jgi:hypothetical protein